MEHQAQSLVLVDGEWVQRPLDVFHLLARAQESDIEMQEAPSKPPSTNTPPNLALLSRTILPSPVTKGILPACLRQKDVADIVLVGEDSVQLKEIRDYGHFRHIARKSDFKGRILCAAVFGDPRETPNDKIVSNPLLEKHAMHRERRSTTDDEGRILPPEVVVLTLTNRTLMFLWTQSTNAGAVTFKQRTINLPNGASFSSFDRFGSRLAVDSRGRAIAVAPYAGQFILYKTKAIQTWRDETHRGDHTVPIADERIIPIDGDSIMHMDFLSSGVGDDEFHVVLLFIVSYAGQRTEASPRTKIICYDWDCRHDLSSATARTEWILVDSEDHRPSLLIPSSLTSDFFLVFDSHISAYKDILTGSPIRIKAPIPSKILPSLSPGDSGRRPVWTAWNRAPRNHSFSNEALYITREDGRIMYVERNPHGSLDMDDGGEWPSRIDTAFACLRLDNSASSQLNPDVLITGGAGHDGLLCKFGAWPNEYSYSSQYPPTNQVTFVNSIPDWSPLTALSVHRPSISHAIHGHHRDTIFVANGSSPNGEISELRYGLRASVDDSFSGMMGCTGLWVIDYGSQIVESEGSRARRDYAVFIVTLPLESLVISIDRIQPESRDDNSSAWEEGGWNKTQIPTELDIVQDDIMRDEETISACAWSDTFAIQITQSTALVLDRGTRRSTDSVSFENNLLLATSRPAFPFIAFASRDSIGLFLEILPISGNGTFVQSRAYRTRFATEPTCIELLEIRGDSHVFLSTSDSNISLFSVDLTGNASVVLEDSLRDVGSIESHVLCESAALLILQEQQVLVCATRNGFLLYTDFMRHRPCTPQNWKRVKMGVTSAQIMRSQTDSSAAFVSCGSDFCRVRCSADTPSILEIESTWFADRINPAYFQSPVTAMSQLPFLEEIHSIGRNIGGFLFVVAGDHLLFSQLDSDIGPISQDVVLSPFRDSTVVKRSFFLGASPTNALLIESIHKMLVSTRESIEGATPPNGYRVLNSNLKLLNLHDDKPIDEPSSTIADEDASSSQHVVAQFSLKHAERVYTMIEWPFVDHRNKKYTLIIVGTGVRVNEREETGRRLIFSTGKSGTKLVLQKESIYHQPVYCIALWSNEATVSVVGTSLSIDFFDSEAGRWTRRGKKELPSPGMHISVITPYVYVSTLRHSHIAFKVVGSLRERYYDFEQVFTDDRERSGTRHLVLDLPNTEREDSEDDRVVLFSDKLGAALVGLHHAPERRFKNAASTVFEAKLPKTVIRLQRGDIRPPWRRPAHGNKSVGVLVDDIVGACTDGTLYAFSILAPPAHMLLCFLQNLIEEKRRYDPTLQNVVVSPSSSQTLRDLVGGIPHAHDKPYVLRAWDVDPRPRKDGHKIRLRNSHVDGDLLVRWLDEGGDMRKLVVEGTEIDVWRCFGELAGDWKSGEVETDADRLMAEVREWVREVLAPVL